MLIKEFEIMCKIFKKCGLVLKVLFSFFFGEEGVWGCFEGRKHVYIVGEVQREVCFCI